MFMVAFENVYLPSGVGLLEVTERKEKYVIFAFLKVTSVLVTSLSEAWICFFNA